MTGVDMVADRNGWRGAWRAILVVLGAGAAACAFSQPVSRPAKQGLCAACHGLHGHSTLAGTPHLDGQDEQYLVAQLLAFREGRRDNAPMRAAVGSLTEKDLREIARWYAAQGCQDDVGKQ
jgi:cytochrome c553